MTDTQPEYRINPSLVMAHAPVLIRQALLVLGGMGMIAHYAQHGDLTGLLGYLHSDAFSAWVTILAGAVALSWGQFRAFEDRKRLVTIAAAAPDSVAIVTEPSPPPAVEPDPPSQTGKYIPPITPNPSADAPIDPSPEEPAPQEQDPMTLKTFLIEAEDTAIADLKAAGTIVENIFVSDGQKLVATAKETFAGTAVTNIVSALESNTMSGTEKMETVVTAAVPLLTKLVSSGGLSGLVTTVEDFAIEFCQSVYNDFKAAGEKALGANDTSGIAVQKDAA